MLHNPDRGIVEADEMDFRHCLSIQRPYLRPVVGHYTDWTPHGVNHLFPELVDDNDPWQYSVGIAVTSTLLEQSNDGRALCPNACPAEA
jgi:homospermidine synthase